MKIRALVVVLILSGFLISGGEVNAQTNPIPYDEDRLSKLNRYYMLRLCYLSCSDALNICIYRDEVPDSECETQYDECTLDCWINTP